VPPVTDRARHHPPSSPSNARASAARSIRFRASQPFRDEKARRAGERLEQALKAVGPYKAATIVAQAFNSHQILRFGITFRREVENKVEAEDNYLGNASAIFGGEPVVNSATERAARVTAAFKQAVDELGGGEEDPAVITRAREVLGLPPDA